MIAQKAFELLNQRFREQRVPYEIVDGQLERLERALPMVQTITPALAMLNGDQRFAAAARELQDSVDYLRAGARGGKVILHASLALEGTVLGIARERKWSLPAKRQLGPLLATVRGQALLGGREQATLEKLCAVLDTQIAGARNTEPGAAHAVDPARDDVDLAVAEFVLDVSCAGIKLLYTAFRRLT